MDEKRINYEIKRAIDDTITKSGERFTKSAINSFSKQSRINRENDKIK